MKRALYAVILLLVFSACASGHVADFQRAADAFDSTAKEIALQLEMYEEIKNAIVQVGHGGAVISLDLAGEYSDADVIAIKQAVAAHVRGRYAFLEYVTVNTTLDMFMGLQNEDDSAEERQIKRQLTENEGKDIFSEIIPAI